MLQLGLDLVVVVETGREKPLAASVSACLGAQYEGFKIVTQGAERPAPRHAGTALQRVERALEGAGAVQWISARLPLL